MRVVGPRVLVKRIDAPAVKSSLIQVVEYDPDPSNFGIVLGVGWREFPNGVKQPIEDITVGDVVILKTYSGAPIEVDGEEAQMVMVDDCLAVVEL